MPLKTPGAYSAHMRNEMDGCEEWIRVRGGGRELRERERDIEKQRERERKCPQPLQPGATEDRSIRQ